MGNFTFQRCNIDGLVIIEPKIYGDERGYFMESYHYEEFKEAGISKTFVQDNQSLSKQGVLRGLHYQKTYPQGKLVRVLKGTVFDVAVDMRKNSPTLGEWYGIILSEENKKMFYVPEGFAHGFLVLSEEAVFSYKCTDFYHPEDEGGILWCDNEIGIKWPVSNDLQIIVSEKDNMLPRLKDNEFRFDM